MVVIYFEISPGLLTVKGSGALQHRTNHVDPRPAPQLVRHGNMYVVRKGTERSPFHYRSLTLDTRRNCHCVRRNENRRTDKTRKPCKQVSPISMANYRSTNGSRSSSSQWTAFRSLKSASWPSADETLGLFMRTMKQILKMGHARWLNNRAPVC
ncbi:hypothetical protein M2418_005022 [Rhizobium sp. BIGb0125]|nr:hypothetical protein [Rhizobium sp. BIGb0125]